MIYITDDLLAQYVYDIWDPTTMHLGIFQLPERS